MANRKRRMRDKPDGHIHDWKKNLTFKGVVAQCQVCGLRR